MKALSTTIITLLLLMLFNLNMKGQEIDRKKLIKAKEEVTKVKVSFLQKLSKALKFTANARSKERRRVIDLIDTLLKDSVYKDNQVLINAQDIQNESFKAQIEDLCNAMLQLQAKLKDKPLPNPNPNTGPYPATTDPDVSVEDEKVNNDKYVADLIQAILSPEKGPAEAASAEKQQRLSLIRNLMLQPALYKDTVNGMIERERSIQLKPAAEVWGFYPYTSGEIELNYKIYGTVVINGYNLNGNTGRSINNLDLSNYEVSRRAKSTGSRLILGITADQVNTKAFMESDFAQEQFISKIVPILAENHFNGLNIQLKSLKKNNAARFSNFITRLSTELTKNGRNFLLSITIPAFDIDSGYEMAVLGKFTDRFLIDFTQKLPGGPGPLAPLKQQSDYSIETCLSRYLNTSRLLPAKFIIILPFYGIKWDQKIKTGNNNPNFIAYNQIRARYQFIPVSYDDQTASAIIEVGDSINPVHEKIWFDNENTLGKKFDLVLNDGLAGVAVWELTADIGYGELAEELAYKFLAIDTLTVKSRNIALHNHKFGWDYIISNLKTYYYLLGNPCSPANDYADYTVLNYINIIFGALSLGFGIFCFYKIKNEGEQWKEKRLMLTITGIMTFMLITSLFALLYIDADIAWFGVDKDCSDMPFLVLYMIILAGITLGILLMRFLLFPIVKREDMP